MQRREYVYPGDVCSNGVCTSGNPNNAFCQETPDNVARPTRARPARPEQSRSPDASGSTTSTPARWDYVHPGRRLQYGVCTSGTPNNAACDAGNVCTDDSCLATAGFSVSRWLNSNNTGPTSSPEIWVQPGTSRLDLLRLMAEGVVTGRSTQVIRSRLRLRVMPHPLQ